jgi:O-antigen/teichoic acid export membrane protein
VTASVAGVLIASVKIKSPQKENNKTLGKSLLLVLGIGGLAMIAFSLLPRLSVSILIGHKYADYAYLLPWLSLSMLLSSVNNLLFSYQIALRKYATLFPAIVGILLLGTLIALNHDTLKHIAVDYIICNAVICGITLIQIFRRRVSNV